MDNKTLKGITWRGKGRGQGQAESEGEVEEVAEERREREASEERINLCQNGKQIAQVNKQWKKK